MRADRIATALALAALAAIALMVAIRLQLVAPWATVDTAAGPVRTPNALAGVDHPFHAARAEVLRRSLAAGEIPRWIGNHQQGYPAEFYPLGAAWLALAAWALALGSLPVAWAHGVAVGVVLLLPGCAFWLLARRDALPAGTAVLALAAHVAVPGAWWHGGYTELVQWGLVTNVAGAAWAMVAFALLVRWLADGRGRDGAFTMTIAALAVLTNPRSAFGLAVLGLAALVVCTLESSGRAAAGEAGRGGRSPTVLARALVAGLGAALLAAPLLVSLARFSGLYVFKHYGTYEDWAAYLQSSVVAVSPPVFVAAIAGVVLAWTPLGQGRPGTRAAAIALPLYAALTWAVATGVLPVGQLEPTRLMPLQRLLTVWSAAAAIGMVLTWLGSQISARRSSHARRTSTGEASRQDRANVWASDHGPYRDWRPSWLPVAASLAPIVVGAALLGWWLRPGGDPLPLPGPPDAPTRGLFAVTRTTDPSFPDLERAVLAADSAAPPGTALLVAGSALSWHEQLWAPTWSDRPFLYDDWLWTWRPDLAGTPGYRFDRGHFYPDPERTLDRDYLDRFGIGAVVATGAVAAAAESVPWLEEIPGGAPGSVYRAWRVADPTAILTVGGANGEDATWANGRIAATALSGGEVLLRHAWFPRWRASSGDGAFLPDRMPDGTMRIADIPPGARVELRYATDAIDWTARACVLAGVALALATWTGWPKRFATRRLAGLATYQ